MKCGVEGVARTLFRASAKRARDSGIWRAERVGPLADQHHGLSRSFAEEQLSNINDRDCSLLPYAHSSLHLSSRPPTTPATLLRNHAEHPHTAGVREDRSLSRHPICTTPDFPEYITVTAKNIPEKRLCYASRYEHISYREEQDNANNTSEEKDLVIIGGGVAGYVAAIKAGQEGLKVGALQEDIPIYISATN